MLVQSILITILVLSHNQSHQEYATIVFLSHYISFQRLNPNLQRAAPGDKLEGASPPDFILELAKSRGIPALTRREIWFPAFGDSFKAMWMCMSKQYYGTGNPTTHELVPMQIPYEISILFSPSRICHQYRHDDSHHCPSRPVSTLAARFSASAIAAVRVRPSQPLCLHRPLNS